MCYVITIDTRDTAHHLEVLNKYDVLTLKHRELVMMGWRGGDVGTRVGNRCWQDNTRYSN